MNRETLARVIFGLTALCFLSGMFLSVWLSTHSATVPYTFGAIHNNFEYGTAGGKVAGSFLYFTIWSNVLVFIVSVMLAVRPNRTSQTFRVFRLTSLVMIVLTGLIYNLVLAPFVHNVNAVAIWDNDMLHRAVPLLAVAGWLIYGPRIPFTRKTLYLSMVIPLTYAAFTLLHGLVPVANQVNDHWYPYPFLDAAKIGYGLVLLAIVIVTALYIGCAWGIMRLDRVLPALQGQLADQPLRDFDAASTRTNG